MASNIGAYIKNARTKHTVGTVTGFQNFRTFTNGAKVSETNGVDNFCLVEMVYVDGIPTVKYATSSATAENTFLTVTPEAVLESYGEKLCDFYNGKDELANIAYLPKGFTFETSNCAASTGVALEVGKFVVWDATNKKFVTKAKSSGSGESTTYSNALETTDVKGFQIIGIEDDERYNIDGLTLIELAVVR